MEERKEMSFKHMKHNLQQLASAQLNRNIVRLWKINRFFREKMLKDM